MKQLNRLLTNQDREELKPTIDQMFELCPGMMSRKISEANVQQAFTLSTALNVISNRKVSILSAGSFEDTATESLKKLGYSVTDVDPAVNYDLHTFSLKTFDEFDVIISTSVLEHVANDEEFIKDCCNLLSKDGYAIFTMDFKEGYKEGDPLPATDVRFYTNHDLNNRLRNVLEENGCNLVGDYTNWTGEPDFHYQGHDYSFATFVFKKGQD